MAQPSEILDTVSVISLLVLCVLGMRRLLRIEGLHALRVVVFTALLWGGAFYLFSLACSDMFQTGCDVINFESDVYTCTET